MNMLNKKGMIGIILFGVMAIASLYFAKVDYEVGSTRLVQVREVQ